MITFVKKKNNEMTGAANLYVFLYFARPPKRACHPSYIYKLKVNLSGPKIGCIDVFSPRMYSKSLS